MRYNSPVAMPTVFVDPYQSYKEGYRVGFFSEDSDLDDNPYVFAEGVHDWEQWREGYEDGLEDHLQGKSARYQSSEN